MTSRKRLWVIIGLVLAVVAGVAVAILQATGSISDPGELVCDFMRGCDP
jgi:flagellar biosynthesis protein FliQ